MALDLSSLRTSITGVASAGNTSAGNTTRAQHISWKLNQVLLATVINSSSRGKLLQIDGDTYKPLNGVQAEAGKNLQLKVTSLSPFLELALLDTAKISERPGIKPAIILSEKLLHQSIAPDPKNTSGLLRIMQVLDSLPAQAMSPATAALYAALQQRIVYSSSLTNSRSLKPALRDSSLLMGGSLHPDDAGEEDSDMKTLLLQIVRGLGSAGADQARSAGRGQTAMSTGLALYQSVLTSGVDVAALAAKEAEDEFLRMFFFHKSIADHAEEQSEEQGQRWLFELPFRFQNRVRSVSIGIYEEDQKQRGSAESSSWAAHFGFELPRCGHLEVTLCILDPAISITIECELVETANLLVHHQQALQEKLISFGLKLTAFTCSTRPAERFSSAPLSSAPLSSAPFTSAPLSSSGLTNARSSNTGSSNLRPSNLKPSNLGPSNLRTSGGSIELTELNMQRNSRKLPPLSAIPGLLYCAMASLFGYILDIEDKIRCTARS